MNQIYSILGLNFKVMIEFLKDLPEASGYAIRK